MTTKQYSIAVVRPWLTTNSLGAHLHELLANLKSVLQIPTGYQDETGFHFGAETAKNEIKWPTA
jgi:hypothetical protein